MPTGYTAMIDEKDASFEEFVWACARNFGALVHMRYDSLGAPVLPEVKPLTDYHAQQLCRLVAECAALDAATDDELLRQWDADNAARLATENGWVSLQLTREAAIALCLALDDLLYPDGEGT